MRQASALQQSVQTRLVRHAKAYAVDPNLIQQRGTFAGSELARAIRTTFERRGVAIPETPLALTPALADVEGKRDQWKAFLRKNGLAHIDFGDVIRDVSEFLLPVARCLALGRGFDRSWPPGGPWG